MNFRSVVITVLVTMLVALFLAVGLPFGKVADAAPVSAPQQLINYTLVQLVSANGITQSVTGAQKTTAQYETADCYSVVDVSSTQTVTLALQHSADAANWVTLYTFPAVTADTTSFTHTLLYGQYMRATATLGSANPVTATLKCVLKD